MKINLNELDVAVPRYKLCNGTRLLCRSLFMNTLDVEILTGSNAGKRAFFA
jgi:hypothetical protein